MVRVKHFIRIQFSSLYHSRPQLEENRKTIKISKFTPQQLQVILSSAVEVCFAFTFLKYENELETQNSTRYTCCFVTSSPLLENRCTENSMTQETIFGCESIIKTFRQNTETDIVSSSFYTKFSLSFLSRHLKQSADDTTRHWRRKNSLIAS